MHHQLLGQRYQLVELNQWGPHSYSRDQLIDMLDKEIAAKDVFEK